MILVVILLLVVECLGSGLVQQRYFNARLCDVSDRINHGCMTVSSWSTSLISCAVSCTTDNLCVGSSMDGNGLCFKHFTCPAVSGCTVEDDQHVYMSKMCDNGGMYEPGTKSCKCVDGWVGGSCQERPKKCKDLISNNYPKGFHWTALDLGGQSTPVGPVYCYIAPDSGYNSIKILNHRGKTDFNLTWEEYRRGFFHNPENMWIGFDNWHAVSNNGYSSLTIALHFDGDSDSDYRSYYDFVLKPESEGFSFDFSGQTSGLGDCFGQYKNTPFSSWDRDNDQTPSSNCAAMAGHGWWFVNGDCRTVCNPWGLWGVEHATKPPSQRLVIPGKHYDTLANMVGSMYMYIQDYV